MLQLMSLRRMLVSIQLQALNQVQQAEIEQSQAPNLSVEVGNSLVGWLGSQLELVGQQQVASTSKILARITSLQISMLHSVFRLTGSLQDGQNYVVQHPQLL